MYNLKNETIYTVKDSSYEKYPAEVRLKFYEDQGLLHSLKKTTTSVNITFKFEQGYFSGTGNNLEAALQSLEKYWNEFNARFSGGCDCGGWVY